MQKVFLAPFYIIAAAFIGIGDTLYLSYYQHLGLVPGCALLSGCEKVLTSVYSKLFGLPLAYFGLVFYIYMVALAILLVVEPRSKALRLGTLAYTGVGLACSIGFVILQLFVIKAICIYCMTSAATTLILFSLAVWHFRSTRA